MQRCYSALMACSVVYRPLPDCACRHNLARVLAAVTEFPEEKEKEIRMFGQGDRGGERDSFYHYVFVSALL